MNSARYGKRTGRFMSRALAGVRRRLEPAPLPPREGHGLARAVRRRFVRGVRLAEQSGHLRRERAACPLAASTGTVKRMAQPTLKDVMDVIAKLDAKVDAHRAETRADAAKVDARFDRVDKGLAELDRDLTKHMDVHREIEKDIEALKARPARTAARAPRRPRTR